MVRITNRILSPTAINTYLSCPRKFYFRYIKKLKTRPSIYLIRGQIAHKVLNDFHESFPRGPPKPTQKEIEDWLLKRFEKRWNEAHRSLKALHIEQGRLRFFHDETCQMLKNFSDWFYEHNLPFVSFSEQKLFSKPLHLMGIIDAVHSNGNEVFLVDYKTSKSDEITPDIMRQAALYALLYQDRFKKVPEVVWIHFLRFKDGPKPIFIDENLLHYGHLLITMVLSNTNYMDEASYPCKCGGYCERDFIRKENG